MDYLDTHKLIKVSACTILCENANMENANPELLEDARMRIDRIKEDGLAIPVGPVPTLHDLTLDDPSITPDLQVSGRGNWNPIKVGASLRLRLASTQLAREISKQDMDGEIAWFALCDQDRRVFALSVIWKTDVCIDPDELILALQDPTGQVRNALLQPWHASIVETGAAISVSEADIDALLSPAGLACIGQERRPGLISEIDLYLAEI
ncbi:hypothetical protein KUV57_13455 [Epibacterium sp. DP7N7-1]|nr:hypothetical protein [Epibacterium sp. DP7N7-1]